MRGKISKTFFLVVIVLFLGVVFAPCMSAVSISKPKTLDGTVNIEFYICRVIISGITDIYWLPSLGWVVESNGTTSVKSMVSNNVDTGEKNYFDEFQYTGHSITVLHYYLLRHSSEKNQMEGLSIGVFFWYE